MGFGDLSWFSYAFQTCFNDCQWCPINFPRFSMIFYVFTMILFQRLSMHLESVSTICLMCFNVVPIRVRWFSVIVRCFFNDFYDVTMVSMICNNPLMVVNDCLNTCQCNFNDCSMNFNGFQYSSIIFNDCWSEIDHSNQITPKKYGKSGNHC